MSKRERIDPPFTFKRVAAQGAAAAAQEKPPFLALLRQMHNVVQTPQPGKSIVYWMRMGDLRSKSHPIILNRHFRIILQSSIIERWRQLLTKLSRTRYRS